MAKVNKVNTVKVLNIKTQEIFEVTPTIAEYMTTPIKDAKGKELRPAEYSKLDSSKGVKTATASKEVIKENADLKKQVEDLQIENSALKETISDWETYAEANGISLEDAEVEPEKAKQ